MEGKKKVLLIDDEEMHLYTAKGLLESDRIEVITHQGSFGATHRVLTAKPDLVLLDINMPALAGDNLVKLIKSFCARTRIPILFYSSNDEATLKRLAETHGIQGYICKGDIIALRGKVHEQLSAAA